MLSETKMCLRVDVRKAIESLSSLDRQLICFLLVEGLTTRETAARLDVPLGSVTRLYRRALKRLQRRLCAYAADTGLYAEK